MKQRLANYIRQNHLGLLCLFLFLAGGTAYAAGLKDDSVKSKHIRDGAVKSADVADDGLTGNDILESSLDENSLPEGPEGPEGPPGDDGADGSPDTAAQVLAKLLTVDGAGSGLDADTLDGVSSSAFLGSNAKAADADLLDGLNSSAFLGANAKAADSDKLDNLDSSDFARAQGATFTDAGLPPLVFNNCEGLPDGWYDWSPDSDNPVSYYRDPFGIVHLRGTAWRCGPDNPVPPIVQLPQGFRPGFVEHQVVPTGGALDSFAVARISSSGLVTGTGLGSRILGLDGITFRCGPSGANGCP